MITDAKKLLEKYAKACSKKSKVDTKYREVFKYIMPDRDTYNYPDKSSNSDNFDSKRATLFSSVSEQAGMSFVNKIQAMLTPIKGNWIELKANDLAQNKEDLDAELEKIASLCNQYKNCSNFDRVVSEFYGDLIAGTCCLLVQKNTPKNPLIFTAVPIKNISILEGVHSEVAYVFRKFEIRKELLPFQWVELRDMPIGEDGEKEIEIIECVEKDYESNLYRYYVIDKTKEKELLNREYKTNPFIVLRWFKGAGELYGRGVGMQALNDAITLNKMTEYDLRSAAYKLPTYLAQQDATFDPDDFVLEPGALNFVPSTATNNPSVMALPVSNAIDSTKLDMEVLEARIKKIMLDTTIPDKMIAGITATEIIERADAMKLNISSVFGRLENEFLIPLVKNIINILQEFDIISKEFDLDLLDGLGYRIEINTPLLKQQKSEGLRGVVNTAAILAQFDPTGQLLNSAFKVKELLPFVMDNGGVPSNLYNSSEEFEQNIVQQSQAQANAQQQQANADTQRQMAIDTNKAEANK